MKAPAFFHDRGIRRYDDAGRLVKFHSEDSTYDLRWNLTAAGNWRQVKDYMYYTNLDVREHNAQNEISRHQVRVSGSFVDVKPEVNLNADSYDIEGNLRETAADNAQQMDHQFAMVYDAWNRLVKVRKGTAPPLAHYARDGLGRIIVNQASNEHWYYDGWRLVSVFDDDLADDGLVKEYVWGVRYIDEIASTVSYAGSAVRRYHLQDANWNVVLTLDSGAADQEAIMYDPYGKPEFWIKAGSYFRYGDLTSPYGTDVLFHGRSYACLSANFPGGTRYLRLYDFRHRAYSPALGRFLQRDPIGVWLDGENFGNAYTLVGNASLVFRDPFGLLAGRDRLRGRDWSMDVDEESCKCCKLTSADWNLERLLEIAYGRIPTSVSTLSESTRECMQNMMKGGNILIKCLPESHPWCGNGKHRGLREGMRICICCYRNPLQGWTGLRDNETRLASTIMHEIGHMCGAVDPEVDPGAGPEHLDPVRILDPMSYYLYGGEPMPPRIQVRPNPYAVEAELVDKFDGWSWDPKTGLPRDPVKAKEEAHLGHPVPH